MSSQTVYDLLIVGAGPASLALCARLSEPAPSALFTDEEHRRYAWIRDRAARVNKSGKAHNVPQKKSVASKTNNSSSSPVKTSSELEQDSIDCHRLGGLSTLVLDAEGSSFLTRWRRLFRTYDISHLRSPMFFHVDPSDRDALWGYAFSQGQVTEGEDIKEIASVVGKERSKHGLKKERRGKGMSGTEGRKGINERDRKDYFAPSRQLFEGHVENIVRRYGLDDDRLIKKDVVQQIKRVCLDDSRQVFEVKTSNHVYLAEAVVVATGPPGISPSLQNRSSPARWPKEAVTHSSALSDFPCAWVKEKITRKKSATIAIVGGGLTAAQLTDLALRKGVSKVLLIIRGKSLKVKPFDVDLEWIGKFKNTAKAAFWSANSDEERLEMVRNARGGGSVTPIYAKLLKRWVMQNRLQIIYETVIEDIRARREGEEEAQGAAETPDGRIRRDSGYDSSTDSSQGSNEKRRWKVQTSPASDLVPVDHVYFATGSAGIPNAPVKSTANPAKCQIPWFLQQLQRQHPIGWLPNGPFSLPVVTQDLSWNEEIPLYVMGALAALQLGPGAANLEGARLGSERCAWAIEEHFRRASPSGSSTSEPGDLMASRRGDVEGDDMRNYWSGTGGRYASLSMDDGDDE